MADRFKACLGYVVTRRTFFRYTVLFPGVSALALKSKPSHAEPMLPVSIDVRPTPVKWPEFVIRRAEDELYLHVTAVGYALEKGGGRITPSHNASLHALVFTFPPQHYPESALFFQQIPATISDVDLGTIRRIASRPSRLVFYPRLKTALSLDAKTLLSWEKFELITPDLDRSAPHFTAEVADNFLAENTRIELPWGVELAPVPAGGEVAFRASSFQVGKGGWTELWTATQVRIDGKAVSKSVEMEVFSVRGYEYPQISGSDASTDLSVKYRLDPSGSTPFKSTALDDIDRLGLIATFSRRFPYSGYPGPPPYKGAQLKYDGAKSITAGYAPGNTVTVEEFRLSARGGFLRLHAHASVQPGVAVSAWKEEIFDGRDTEAEVVYPGFLYPFGTPCELVFETQTIFSRDTGGYFVAPLNKQYYIRVQQPNLISFDHPESPFTSLAITTDRTPPLDPPPGGDFSQIKNFDYFVPTVNGKPVQFEHSGIDWGGAQHHATTTLIFVGNTALEGNGLIWEPGYPWSSTTAPDPNAVQAISPATDGLRAVDKLWATQAGRFAHYNGELMSLAKTEAKGDTAQRVDWVEWVRSGVADLAPRIRPQAPFLARARTFRITLQSVGQISGTSSALIGTYRDIRLTASPFLDPEPTTPRSEYLANVVTCNEDIDQPYVVFLETRALIDLPATPPTRDDNTVASDIRDLYYRTKADPNPLSIDLFRGISNEIRFGISSSVESMGAMSLPDTHANFLNRHRGLLGDASFNERRWQGYGSVKPKFEASGRLDYAALSAQSKRYLDTNPFELSSTDQARSDGRANARSIMGYSAAKHLLAVSEAQPATNGFIPGLNLGDMFGLDAQVLPGLAFKDIFEDVPLAGSSGDVGEKAASPLVWNVKLTGIDWLEEIMDSSDGLTMLSELVPALVGSAKVNNDIEPLALGSEATLRWTNSAFKEKKIGPVSFLPVSSDQADGGQTTTLAIDAAARIDLGVAVLKSQSPFISFTPGKPSLSASVKMGPFGIEIFGAIHIDFESIEFRLETDGSRHFSVNISNVRLLGDLEFINQLQKTLGGLGEGSGIHITLSPEKIRIYQTLAFPPTGNKSLFLGPAQVTNLSFSWSVSIPLIGRDVISIGFGVSSRDKPLTIFVPPWYGGKAYALIESTTKGCRLVEISMEYGALIPIDWGIATGQASLTAGIFFSIDAASSPSLVTLTGFVKAAANLSVASIIKFTGLIYIAVTKKGDAVEGTAKVTVSIKIAFARVSYSFEATHRDSQAGGGGKAVVAFAPFSKARGVPHSTCNQTFVPPNRMGPKPDVAIYPFGRGYGTGNRKAHSRLVAAYA